MGKLSFLIIVLFLAVLAFFAISNKEIMTIQVPFGDIYELPKIALILFSSVFGASVVLFAFLVRDTKKYIDTWQHQRKQKQAAKVQELYSKALNSLLANDNEAAKDALEGILVEEPGHISALLRLGDIHASDEDYQKANTYYQKAYTIKHQNLETLFALETLMEKTDRWSEALKYLDDILDIADSNMTALHKKRDILEKQGRWDDLIYLQKTIIKHARAEKDKKREQENLVGFKYEYGRYSLENNQLEKAKKAFKTVLRLEREFVPATLGIAEVMLRENESEAAINLLEKSYEATGSKIVLARLEDLLISLGEPARLISIYKTSISRNPQDQIAKFFLGKLYYRLEMIDDAFEVLTSIDPGVASYPELYQLLGNLFMRRNQPENAVREFKKVIESRSSLRLPYCCTNCGHDSIEWSGRCASCKQWSTYQFNLDGSCTR